MADTKTSIIISAEDKTAAAFASARNGLQGLATAASRLPMLGAALTAAFSGATFTAAINDAIKFTASLDDMAEKTGASVETLSGLARVAQIGGHELGLVEQTTIKLAKGLADADNKSSGAGRALKALGLSAAELRGMDTGQALKAIADRLNQFQDGAGKSALAMDLLGKAGAQALPFLKDLAEQGELVTTTTTEQAAAADKFEKSLARLKVTAGETGRAFVNDLIPPVNEFMEAMNKSSFGGAWTARVDQLVNGGDLRERVKELKMDLAGLEAGQKAPGSMTSGGLFGWVTDARIKRLREEIAAMESMAESAERTQRALWGGGAEPDKPSIDYRSTDDKSSKAKKEKVDPYAGLAGFADNRSAKEIMDQLHAEDKAVESMRQNYIAMADPLQKYRVQLDEINKLRADGTLTAAQATEAEWAVNDAMDATLDKLEGVKDKGTDTFKELAQAIDGFGKDAAGAFVDFAITGKSSFSEMTQSILADLAKMVIYQNVTSKLAGVVSGFFGTGAPAATTANADGGVYSSPSLAAYSSSVVSSPTLFRFANGGSIGLMGEAGAEAIMPLKKGPDGILGVRASGGGGVVVNIIESQTQGGEQRTRQGSGGETVVDVFVAKVKSSLAKDVSTGQGFASVLEGTYGLNRAAGAWG